MKKFSFPLASLMSVREGQKEDALQEYAKALKNRIEIEKHYQEEAEKFDRYQQEMAEDMKGLIQAAVYAQRMSTITQGKEYLSQLKAAVTGFRNREQKMLSVLIEAKNNLDILEKLKKKQKDKFTQECNRKEEMEMEDIINGRRSRL